MQLTMELPQDASPLRMKSIVDDLSNFAHFALANIFEVELLTATIEELKKPENQMVFMNLPEQILYAQEMRIKYPCSAA